MKKILVIHNRYRILGGEDIAVENEVNILSKHFDVKTLYFNNNIDSYFKQIIAFLTNKNKKSMDQLSAIVSEFKPDVAYVHNTWFKASLGIFDVLSKNNVKTLLKLHNFRYDCTRFYLSKNHLNKNEPCPKCGLDRKSTGIINNYFSESFLKTLFVLRYGKKYFQLLEKSNIKLLVLTSFHKEFLLSLGFTKRRIKVFPNYLDISENKNTDIEEDYIVYAGRVSKEKGLPELLKTFVDSDTSIKRIKIIGEGPLLKSLKKEYEKNTNIEFIGILSNSDVHQIIYNSKAVITATKLFEGQPTLLCEASFLGVPSIFPKFGGISEFFPKTTDFSFEQFNYNDLVNKVNLLDDEKLVKQEGLNNQEFIKDYLNEAKLINTFQEIINE